MMETLEVYVHAENREEAEAKVADKVKSVFGEAEYRLLSAEASLIVDEDDEVFWTLKYMTAQNNATNINQEYGVVPSPLVPPQFGHAPRVEPPSLVPAEFSDDPILKNAFLEFKEQEANLDE